MESQLFTPLNQIQQQNKIQRIFRKINEYPLIPNLLFFAYAILSFFKEQIYHSYDPQYIVTLWIAKMPLIPYSILETILMGILVFIKLTRIKQKHERIYCLILLVLTLFVTGYNIIFWVKGNYIPVGLIARPIFLIFFSPWIMRLMLRIVYIFIDCYRYFIAFWVTLFLFACSGVLIYAKDYVDPQLQIFSNIWNAYFNLFVMHTYTSYPDPSLAYFPYSKASSLFFMIIVIINGILIAVMIVSTTYASYIALVQEEENSETGLIQLMFEVIIQRLSVQNQLKYRNSLVGTKRIIFKIFQSRLYNTIIQLYSLILFFIISVDYHDRNATLSQSIALILLNFVILIQDILKAWGHSFKFEYILWFDIYKFVASFVSMIMFFVAVSGKIDFRTYLIFITLLLPSILRYLFNLLRLTDSILRYVKKLQDFTIQLFVLTLIFAGIGQIALTFDDKIGITQDDVLNNLSQGGYQLYYIYANFNTTPASFNTLFGLMTGYYYWNIIYVEMLGSVFPRIFYIFWYTIAVQIVFNQFLAVTFDHIALQTSRETAIASFRSTFRQFLHNKDQIERIFWGIIDQLKKQYSKTNLQKHTRQICDDFSLNFPYPATQSWMLRKTNTYSLIYCNNMDIGDCWFEAATQLRLRPINQIYNLNTLINKIIGRQDEWQKVSVKALLEQNGFDTNQVTLFEQKVQSVLDQQEIQLDFQFNKLQTVAEKYLLERDYDKPVYLIHDLGKQFFSRNLIDLYINQERVGTSFRYKIGRMEYLVQKIQLSKISEYFGKTKVLQTPSEYAIRMELQQNKI